MSNWAYYALGGGVFLGLVGLDLWLEITRRTTLTEWLRAR